MLKSSNIMSPINPNKRKQYIETSCGSSSSTCQVSSTQSPTQALGAFIISFACLLLYLQQAQATTSTAILPKSNVSTVNYLLFSSDTTDRNQDSKLNRLLRDSNHNHASDAINLQLANSVWSRMQQNALGFASQRAQETRPTINRLLEQANVSSECHKSINDIIDHLAKLNQWAVQMYNAFGEFPATGFFEGSHTSMGSYFQCVDLEPNLYIGQPQYCTFKFQPIIPKRPRYHNILAAIENLANFTTKDDMLNKIAGKAHYFYYTKLRLATCMPSKCEQRDLELLGEQVAVNTYLQYSGVECLKKQVGFNPDGAQIFALIVLGSLASIALLGTLVHALNLRSFFAKNLLVNGQHISSLNGLNSTYHQNNKHHTDLNGNNFKINQALSSSQKKTNNSILPTAILNQNKRKPTGSPIVDSISVIDQACASETCTNYRVLHVIDFLLHFSIIKNGRKLFDTSTSAGQTEKSKNHCPGGQQMKLPSSRLNSTDGECSSSNQSTDGSDQSVGDSATGGGRSNEISCVHGLRFWTISWIIFGHTMQYTEWAGFARAYQVEQNIVGFFLQPLLNATFSVDTFFIISGLLTTYVTWSMTRGQYKRFNKFAFLISRYLRLTPQVLLIMLIFIVFPLMGDGPYWRGLIQKESDNCKQNWWVSALYLQAFVNSDKICNLVTWWLSIEMFYHFVSIIVIIALLNSTKKGLFAATALGGGMLGVSCYLHYANSYPPNMLPTLLQRYEVWYSIVLKYFWTPYPHAPAYFVGLILGYVLYTRSINTLTKRQVRLGWVAFTICYLSILFGTYSWNNNSPYSRITSTVYYNLSQLFWALSTGWAILACALGYGGWLNSFLSAPAFIPLGRATYMTYLSHMIIVMSYPAKMNLLIEPSYVVFFYIFISNLVLSYALGITLTLVYESPILHLQKSLVSSMAQKYNDVSTPSIRSNEMMSESEKVVRVSLYTEQQVAMDARNPAA